MKISNQNDLIAVTYSNGEAFIIANRKDNRNPVTTKKKVFMMLNEFSNPLMKNYNQLTSEEQNEIDSIVYNYRKIGI